MFNIQENQTVLDNIHYNPYSRWIVINIEFFEDDFPEYTLQSVDNNKVQIIRPQPMLEAYEEGRRGGGRRKKTTRKKIGDAVECNICHDCGNQQDIIGCVHSNPDKTNWYHKECLRNYWKMNNVPCTNDMMMGSVTNLINCDTTGKTFINK